TGWGDKGTRRQGDKGKDDFSVVCIISPSQINFSVENELALPITPPPHLPIYCFCARTIALNYKI
ncbi:hypothetical protein, partial [[Phormidium] sp. LEGE 05292]|uniref:hypothetical protein n=1 Tax=[Phormidium] sp. LEGE 05292 TaxID=767427 RepID=UPI001D152AAE